MLGKIINKIILAIFILFSYIPSIYAQPLNSIYDNYCYYDTLYLNKSLSTEISEDILSSIVTTNYNKVKDYENVTLTLFREEYQIFLFRNSNCTKKFLNENETKIYNFKNKLHLFSINGTEEDDINYIKLVVQTKKKFYIFLYHSSQGRKNLNPDINNKNYTIKTNIFPYFKNKLDYEEYSKFENQTINIFNESETIFNDMCYIFKTRNETKPPELRKHLYYYKYDNDTYPLLESKDNCNLTNTSISYKNESFILEYTCKHNLSTSQTKIPIYNISILSKEEKETYNGPNSLKDQEKILYCNKETYNNKAIRNNVGFYISLFLLFAVFVCWIVLIVQKYDIARKAPLDAPPKKTKAKDDTSISKKKKVNFSSVEIVPGSKKKKKKINKPMIDDSDDNEDKDENNIKSNTVYKPKKKKKGKKKKKMIDDNNEDNNNEDNNDNDNNNDLEWYSNDLRGMIDDDNKDDDDNKYNNNTEIKIKKKKKKGKKKKGKRKKTNENNDEEDEKAKSDNENEIKGKIKSKISNKINNNKDDNNNSKNVMNKTISNFPNAYNKLKDNSAKEIKDNLHLRRLVIITNLGKNLEENDFNFNDNELIKKSHLLNVRNNNENNSNDNIINSIEINNKDKDKDKEEVNKEIATNDNLRKNNSLLPILRDNIVNEDQNERNIKMTKIVGFEDDTFLSNIKRDYLIYEDAIFFDNREYCSLFAHFLKLKNDLINIFCCNYSFAPYTIRLIKFLFFFHFMFYLETLCIGQKYYFKKYFSEEYQSYIENMYNLENNITNNINSINININITKNLNLTNNTNLTNLNTSNIDNKNLSIFDLERYFSKKTIEIVKIHYLYTFKYAFARVLIPVAISYISYFFTAILSPRRKVLKIYLNTDLMQKEKIENYKKISKKYKIVYIVFGTLALLLMVFFFYSITNYFLVFEDAKYDIPQSFLLSGLIRFILDIIIWAIIANIRKLSIDSHSYETYGCIRGICEIN